MEFTSRDLKAQLDELTTSIDVERFVVAFSGGIDSTVLLHALAELVDAQDQCILAVHIDHGLNKDAAIWRRHCRDFAATLGVAYEDRVVSISSDSSAGPEAAARTARYAAFAGIVQDGDCLLTAHHREDQAETLLLNLLRGSGPAGVAAIDARQRFGPGYLLRPLLRICQSEITRYAERHDLHWIDDPSNRESRFDRNFLRNEIIPLLSSRWPAANANLARSADLAREASQLLDDLADIDLREHGSAQRLSIPALMQLSPARRRNLLRRAIRISNLPPAPATRIEQTLRELIPARGDASPLVSWPGAELRRFRDSLFLMAELPVATIPGQQVLMPDGEWLDLGPGLGSLQLMPTQQDGIAPGIARSGLQLRFRSGGERIRLKDRGLTHKLKKLLQQEGVLPWMRDRMPLLYAGEQLVAVADLWIADECIAPQGFSVNWRDKPLLL